MMGGVGAGLPANLACSVAEFAGKPAPTETNRLRW